MKSYEITKAELPLHTKFVALVYK